MLKFHVPTYDLWLLFNLQNCQFYFTESCRNNYTRISLGCVHLTVDKVLIDNAEKICQDTSNGKAHLYASKSVNETTEMLRQLEKIFNAWMIDGQRENLFQYEV